jgi:hypothetical protein
MPCYNNTLPSLLAALLSITSAVNTLLVLPFMPSPAYTTTLCIACLAVLCLLKYTLLLKLIYSYLTLPFTLVKALLLAVLLSIVATTDSLASLALATSCLK